MQFYLSWLERLIWLVLQKKRKTKQVIFSTICLHHCSCSTCTSTDSEFSLAFGFSALTAMRTCKMSCTTAASSLLAPHEVKQHNGTWGPPLPDILSSPTRRMCGQCWSVLMKKGFVTPTTMFGLERKEKVQNNATLGYPPPPPRQRGVGSKHLLATYGAWVLVVYSLNSLSWMVK